MNIKNYRNYKKNWKYKNYSWIDLSLDLKILTLSASLTSSGSLIYSIVERKKEYLFEVYLFYFHPRFLSLVPLKGEEVKIEAPKVSKTLKTQWMNEWIHACMNDWLTDWMNESEWMDACMHACMNARVER